MRRLRLIPYLIPLLIGGCGSSGTTGAPAADENTTNNVTAATSLSPSNEPYYKYEWHLNPLKSALTSLGYTIDDHADINISDSWTLTKGNGVTVAVIDEGFDITHEDLAPNIAAVYNADEQNQDVSSDSTEGAHGSSVASFIASPVNSIGVTGVAPGSKLLLIKQWSTSDADTIRAFEYARDHGAKVINCSWGTGAVSPAVEAELKAMYDAGITVVFASGNTHRDMDLDTSYHDESEVEWVIGVGATDENNDVSVYSDYGYNIDILAPGGDTWTSTGILSIDDMGSAGSTDQLDGIVNNNYAFVNGTSFSSPIVAGVAALMYAIKPDITPKEVRDILIATAEKVGGEEHYGADGFDLEKYRAYGKINADRATAAAEAL